MDSIASNPYAAGAIILTLIGALITIVKLHTSHIQKIIADHQAENQKVREQSAAQTMVIVETMKNEGETRQRLSQSIDELKEQQKETGRIQQETAEKIARAQQESADKITAMFNKIILQGVPARKKKS